MKVEPPLEKQLERSQPFEPSTKPVGDHSSRLQLFNSVNEMEENGDPFRKSSVVDAKIVEDYPPPPQQQLQIFHGMKENGDSLVKYQLL